MRDQSEFPAHYFSGLYKCFSPGDHSEASFPGSQDQIAAFQIFVFPDPFLPLGTAGEKFPVRQARVHENFADPPLKSGELRFVPGLQIPKTADLLCRPGIGAKIAEKIHAPEFSNTADGS
jgi:hypothetical protein